MGALKSFFDANRRFSQRITPAHLHEADVSGHYRKIGTIVMSHPQVRRVADAGAGGQWQFPAHYKDWYGLELIGLDIDGAAMDGNTALDRRIVCDAAGEVPLDDGSVDLVMASSGVEHFPDNRRFLQNVFRILRPGGFLLAQFPSRYAPFALANRLLPPAQAKRLLRLSMGETDLLGFKAYYDRTNYSAFRALSERVGFREIYHQPGYFSSCYFEFFSPLFAVSYVFDMVRYALGIRDLASYNLFLLEKPSPDGSAAQPFRLYAWK
jgi:SAM-dependent methyltransferase